MSDPISADEERDELRLPVAARLLEQAFQLRARGFVADAASRSSIFQRQSLGKRACEPRFRAGQVVELFEDFGFERARRVRIANENVIGSIHNDTITGDGNANQLDGGAGNDSIDGGGGNDTLIGGAGIDILVGGIGTDRVDYSGSTSGIVVALSTGTTSNDGLGGTDTLSGIENVTGSAFADTLTGDGLANRLDGGAGNDLLRVTVGADTLDGGADNDRINFSQTGITYSGTTGVAVNLAAGTADSNSADAFNAASSLISIEFADGTAGSDVFVGGDSSHLPDSLGNRVTEAFRPFGGDDTITGGDPGLGYFYATRVEYTSNTSGQAVTVNLGVGTADDGLGGTDDLNNVTQAYGGAGNDTLYGGSQARSANGGFFELFRGNAGNDTIDGAGTDLVLGAAGADRADYSNNTAAQAIIVNLGTGSIVVGSDTVLGGTAKDGLGFTDTLLNIDQVYGGSGNDTFVGGAANETFNGNAGNDLLNGGGGSDEARYDTSTSRAIVNLGTTPLVVGTDTVAGGTAMDGLGGIDTLVSIERVRGSDFDDYIQGSDSSAQERFAGDMGNDTINGGGGDRDFASYYGNAMNLGGINAFVENGSGSVNDGFGTVDTLINIEGLEGTHSNDTLAGGQGDQWFIGRGGSDTINGGMGSDWVTYSTDPAGVTVDLGAGTATDGWGGPIWALGGTDSLISVENAEGSNFNDSLTGSGGANELRGRTGDDILVGGGGNDILVGGGGADIFDWNAGDEGSAGSPAVDTVSDFDATPALGTDALDVRDILVGENSGNLDDFLDFGLVGSDTQINVRPTGAGDVSQQIILQSVDLTNGGILSSDAAIISNLLSNGKLITD